MTRAAALELCAVPVDLEERFRGLVVSQRDRARRLAWRLTGGDDGAAEDVVQDAFVNANWVWVWRRANLRHTLC